MVASGSFQAGSPPSATTISGQLAPVPFASLAGVPASELQCFNTSLAHASDNYKVGPASTRLWLFSPPGKHLSGTWPARRVPRSTHAHGCKGSPACPHAAAIRSPPGLLAMHAAQCLHSSSLRSYVLLAWPASQSHPGRCTVLQLPSDCHGRTPACLIDSGPAQAPTLCRAALPAGPTHSGQHAAASFELLSSTHLQVATRAGGGLEAAMGACAGVHD